MEATILICFAAIALGLSRILIRANQRGARADAIIRDVREADPLFYTSRWGLARYQIETIGVPPLTDRPRWRRAVMRLGDKGVALYDVETDAGMKFAFTPGELRWFGRPTKYEPGTNELWMHVQIGIAWYLVKVQFYMTQMQTLIRALKQVATDAQVTAYRRRRPYIHHGLATAYLAEQDIHGAWELKQHLDLYLMPLHLVLFRKGAIDRVLDLHDIQQITASKRLDSPEADGLLRFMVGAETLAFALRDYTTWADSLAEAAKRTLEEPPVRKQKSQYDEDDEWEVEDEYAPETAVSATGL